MRVRDRVRDVLAIVGIVYIGMIVALWGVDAEKLMATGSWR